MANIQPQGPAQIGQPPSEPPSQPLTWEGDKMFNIYIYDYCYKRGFRQTAHHLMNEADIPIDAKPPINARQGLLFEWWSVFWVLFTAKASGTGSDEALIYTQHQAQQNAARQTRQILPPPPPQPAGQLAGQPGLGPQQIPRTVNGGMPSNAQGRAFIPNGPMSNGINPQGPGNPAAFSNPQMNGIPGPPNPPGGPMNVNQSSNFHLTQRPQQMGGPPGQPQQQQPRAFTSPTMDPANQNPGPGQHTPQMSHQQPMGMGPSPHMQPGSRGPMLPPGVSGYQQQQHMGRPPSRTATPGQGGMMTQPSPGPVHRQPPGMENVQQLHAELMKIPPTLLPTLKQETNLDGKDNNSLTPAEKQTLIRHYQMRTSGQKPGPRGHNPVAGPSNSGMPPPPQSRNGRGAKRNSTSPGEDPDNAGSSPPASKRPKRSPMEQPMTPMSYPAQLPQQPQQQGPPQSQPSPMNNNNMMRPGSMGGLPPQNGGFQPGMQPMVNSMGVMMNMGGQMQSQMGGMSNHGMMTPQMPNNYRQSLHAMQPNRPMPPGGMPGNAGSPPSSGDTSGVFNPGGPPPGQFPNPGGPPPGAGNRMPGPGGAQKMLPPPSPKDGNRDGNNKPPEQNPGEAPGTAPATPAPPNSNPNPSMAPSPSAILGNAQPPPPPPPQNGGGMPSTSLGDFDFMTPGLEEFDTTAFRVDDINFERDFGQWFNPNDTDDGLGMK